MPEIKALENYGQPTYEANLNLALLRAGRVYEGLKDAAIRARNHTGALGPRYNLEYGASNAKNITLGSNPPSVEDTQHLEYAMMNAVPDADLFSRLSANIASDRTTNLRFFLDFLKNDNTNLTVDQIVDERLARGFAYVADTNAATSIGSVTIPFTKDEANQIVPDVPMLEYYSAIKKLNDFMLTKSRPSTLRQQDIAVRVYSDHSRFRRDTAAVSPDSGATNTTMGLNVPIRLYSDWQTNPQEVRSSDYVPAASLGSIIYLSDPNIHKADPDFGTRYDLVAETLIHEFGHSVHRTLGTQWGSNPGDELEKAYAPAKAVPITDYGNSGGTKEHFAETFAKLAITGEASDEFKKFLSENVGIKDVDYEKYLPTLFRNNNIANRFEDYLNNVADLDGYKIKISSMYGGAFENWTPETIAADFARNNGVPRADSISIEAGVFDRNGTKVANMSRRFNLNRDGSINIYHASLMFFREAQGLGVGTKIIDSSVEFYKELKKETGRDINTTVYAHGPSGNGAYAWAFTGYDWETDEDRLKRDRATRTLKDYYPKLERFAAEGSPDGDLYMDANELMAKYNISFAEAMDLKYLYNLIGDNGWKVNAELLSEIKDILDLYNSGNRDLISPLKLASLGRRNKRTNDKTTNSLGRHIMMDIISTWHGRIDI